MSNTNKDRRKIQRRRAERVSSKNGWTVSLNSNKDCDVDNISIYGLFVKTKKELPVDSDVKVTLTPRKKSEKPVTVKSKVVWSRRDRNGNFVGLGVEFFDMTEKDQEVVALYVKSVKKERDERS